LYNAIVFEDRLPVTAIDGWNVMNIIAAAIESNLNARKIDLF
jgi:hypothetical protein